MQQATNRLMATLNDVFGYYANTADLTLGGKVEVMPTEKGISFRSSDGGNTQTKLQLACMQAVAEICDGYYIEISREVSNHVQQLFGGGTLNKPQPDYEVRLCVVIPSSTDVPTISSQNAGSKLGRGLAEFCQTVAEQIDEQGGDGAAAFKKLRLALSESEVVRATWVGWADMATATTTVRRGSKKTVTVEVELDDFVPTKKQSVDDNGLDPEPKPKQKAKNKNYPTVLVQ